LSNKNPKSNIVPLSCAVEEFKLAKDKD